MNRRAFVRYIEKQGCLLLREGGRHSVYYDPRTKRVSTVPRHNEINDFLAKKICKDLGIPIV